MSSFPVVLEQRAELVERTSVMSFGHVDVDQLGRDPRAVAQDVLELVTWTPAAGGSGSGLRVFGRCGQCA
jgi:hypothetical protein